MANKKIKKIKIDSADAYDIEDAEAIKSINGYTKADVDAQQVTFANEPITESEITGVLNGSN